MKYSILMACFLMSLAAGAMQLKEKEFCLACAQKEAEPKKPKIIKATVGQKFIIPMMSQDRSSSAFYYISTKPDEAIIEFIAENEEKNDKSVSLNREYRALTQGTTEITFGLYGSIEKCLGNVDYQVIVE